ncbi:MAG: hypothetical protein JNJ63_01040 [Hyphomonadaceae bacterium]|nr:hypothetical protein [Hyphomonadaceae bacterium]
MAERMGLAQWSGVLGTWVGIGAAVFGGYQALKTYDEEVAKMEDARVVQTFQLFEMFNSSERLAARQRVMDAANNGTPFEGHDLWVTLDFYDALQICVERSLCDQDLAVRLFQPYAAPIWGGLSEEIIAGRTPSDPNMGAGVQWMATLPAPEVVAATNEPTPASAEQPEAEAAPAEASAPAAAQ